MSTRILRRIACIAIALGIGVLWMPSPANATMRLELASSNSQGQSTGGTILTDLDNDGGLSFIGPLGVFNMNFTAGASSPPGTPPPGVIALLDLVSLNIASGQAGSITIILENSGYSGPIGVLGAVGLIGGTILNGSVTATMYVDASNAVPVLGADQLPGPLSGPLPGIPGSAREVLSFSSNGGAFAGSGGTDFVSTGTFSLFEKFVITFGQGGGSFSADGSDLVVPEPSSLAIAGIGALGMIGFSLRRRKAAGA